MSRGRIGLVALNGCEDPVLAPLNGCPTTRFSERLENEAVSRVLYHEDGQSVRMLQELPRMSLPRQQIRFCTSQDGTRIAYAAAGSGPPLIHAGSWLTHLELDWAGPIWSHWFEELSRNRTLVRYDHRGTGLSDRSVDIQGMDAWVQDLEAIVAALDLERFPLMGFCQGAAVAVAYAARHPDRVSRLVLYGGYAAGALADGAPAKLRSEAKALEEMIALGWGRNNAAFRKIFVNLLMPDGSEAQLRHLAELEQQAATTSTAGRLWRAFHEVDIRHLAPRVEAPALVVHCRKDAMVPFEEGCRLASLMPNAEFIALESENHLLLRDEPAWSRFATELRSFLGEDPPRPSSGVEAFGELTSREREVLDLMAQGQSNAQIADELCISPKTVRNHVTHIFSKLEVGRRAEAIVQAREVGFGQNGHNGRTFRTGPNPQPGP